jgi:hypothetical protein
MINRLLPIAAALVLLAGCQETPTDTAKDVAKAQSDASQKSQDARKDANVEVSEANKDVRDAKVDFVESRDAAMKQLTSAEAEAMVQTANAAYDVAMTEASGRNKVALELCDPMLPAEKDACVSAAAGELATAQAQATSTRDERLVTASHHD